MKTLLLLCAYTQGHLFSGLDVITANLSCFVKKQLVHATMPATVSHKL